MSATVAPVASEPIPNEEGLLIDAIKEALDFRQEEDWLLSTSEWNDAIEAAAKYCEYCNSPGIAFSLRGLKR